MIHAADRSLLPRVGSHTPAPAVDRTGRRENAERTRRAFLVRGFRDRIFFGRRAIAEKLVVIFPKTDVVEIETNRT